MNLSLGQVADAIHAEGDFTTDVEAVGYSIDSRTVGAGELFFAISGERDGHDFVEAALANGAVAAVVSSHWLAPASIDPCRLLWVPESEDCVLRALQTLARTVRRQWGGRVIGITGSAGKTTTKEMVAAVLGSRSRVLKSAGNLNNHLGVPLQLLRLESEHEIAVLEMGMNHAGEIRTLARIAEPNWAVVSNVAAVHLEFFPEGIAGIAAAKRELVEALPSDGIAILNADDAWVRGFRSSTAARAVLYGISEGAEVRGSDLKELGFDGVRFVASTTDERVEVHLRTMGSHNVSNALSALAAGMCAGVPLAAGAEALAALRPGDKRGEVLGWRGARLVNDCYNSNPRALEAMTEALMATEGRRHIVVAGEMLELGPDGARLHRELGARMATLGVDVIVGVRGLAEHLVQGARETGAEAHFFPTPEEAGDWMARELRDGDAVLLKASRGVRWSVHSTDSRDNSSREQGSGLIPAWPLAAKQRAGRG